MTLTEETPVPQAALPVEAFKAHLRLGTGFAEAQVQDAVLESFLRAALAAIEARTGKILIWRDFSWRLVRLQSGEGQALPVAPVVSLDAVTLIDREVCEAPVPLSRLRLEPDDQRPFLRPHGGRCRAFPRAVRCACALWRAWLPIGAGCLRISHRRCCCWRRITTNTGMKPRCLGAACPLA